MEYIAVFIFGAIIGSFLNVCIYRIPLGKSIIRPRSHCPFCEKAIKWYENIPLASYIVLLGKCSGCKRPIPVRYFLVELITALSAAGLLAYFSLTPPFFIYFLFVTSLIAVTFIDIEHQEIPDVISLPMIVLGLGLFSFFNLDFSSTYLKSFLNSLFGILVGGGSMFLLGVIGELIFKKEALGGGDVKLMAMIGAFLGWKMVLLTFFLSPLFGSIAGIIMKYKFHKDVIPYGPYLAIGAVVSLFFGENILRYLFVY